MYELEVCDDKDAWSQWSILLLAVALMCMYDRTLAECVWQSQVGSVFVLCISLREDISKTCTIANVRTKPALRGTACSYYILGLVELNR